MRLHNVVLVAMIFVSALAVGQHSSPSGAPAAAGADRAPSPSPASGAGGEHTAAPAVTEPHSSSPQASPISDHSQSQPAPARFDSTAMRPDKRVSEGGAGELSHDADTKFKKTTSPETDRGLEKPTELKAKAPEKHPPPCKSHACDPCLRDPANGACVPAKSAARTCQPGAAWNGTRCMPAITSYCQAGALWDGTACVSALNSCADLVGRAHLLAQRAQTLHSEMGQACSQNSSSTECAELSASYQAAVWRYRLLYDQASPTCRTGLVDPDLL